MQRHIYDCEPGCPVESTLQIISGKWKSVILYHLLQEKTCRFGDLQRSLHDCSRRMLALQLKELEADGVIHKKVYQVTPPKTAYRLTDFGKTLEPVIQAMVNWGTHYNNVIGPQHPKVTSCRQSIQV
ncbi:cinnamoyl ester hydrolase-like protein [Agrilactobacillus composti DSM 18527 = JCM 14202]|uniref:Cinnamoyl ester hydrolase-like protein n=1 Tax=Agrilactobacillus composti DSM 18527 = JCM 14202 TaxID=1423734 RepID=X0QKW3_9LACO|nr:helix-turn-helix domain-containing protein [Agrilactobacillus composti]KRM35027.1 cinnamoyl ester hydrolase-like protein [Agrilactobacillus composti DSM 18527 = JCM 14202]GAF39265.1 transcriptional regulator, HxlR family [Agrilactobacillus composti DSM 18527 = JCM 14202]